MDIIFWPSKYYDGYGIGALRIWLFTNTLAVTLARIPIGIEAKFLRKALFVRPDCTGGNNLTSQLGYN